MEELLCPALMSLLYDIKKSTLHISLQVLHGTLQRASVGTQRIMGNVQGPRYTTRFYEKL